MTQENKTLLVVDDNQEILDALSEYLGKSGFDVMTARNGDEMWQQLQNCTPALVILDIMLPGDDGLTLCRKLRHISHVPIIMLTAVTDDADRIAGLEIGADDYITKSFNPRELLARIKALLRRSQYGSEGGPQRKLRFEAWTFDSLKRQLIHDDGYRIALSGADFSLLTLMVHNPNKLLSRDDISMALWGREADPFERGIDVQISRLRKHLRDDDRSLIMTVRNKGYMMVIESLTEV
ncbi:response regulator [Thaumasiovibrio subtropicus]|uniref:response regulator n=1 Tax=Thaumasiovibrio subtropicus TaxID=1891207 RepID=UPI000B3527BB|nr:response regulator transcription factor [Thaumasiovibrio subtropicus]